MAEKNYQETREHWDKYLDRELENESDRACVILAAALLDSALETLLKSHLLPASTSSDPLFDFANAPLSTFSARIEIAYRLGLIDSYFAKALHLIRRIRNDFAHNISGCAFDDTRVLSRMTELKRTVKILDFDHPWRDMYPLTQRGDFQTLVSFLQWGLRSLADRVDPVASEFELELGGMDASAFEFSDEEISVDSTNAESPRESDAD